MATLKDLTLRFGEIKVDFINGQLRNFFVSDAEILRGLYFAVRNSAWGTVLGNLKDLNYDIKDKSFTITYSSEHIDTERMIHIIVDVEIIGKENSTLEWKFMGEAVSDTKKNRIGFCILHPAEAAGQTIRIVDTYGKSVRTIFPQYIEPFQPFFNLSTIEYNGAIVEFDGDIFEMEDQRNWLDASYKTYCTPLGEPFPVVIPKGKKIFQSVKLKLSENAKPVVIPKKKELKGKLANIGTVIDEYTKPEEINLAEELAFSHFRINITPSLSRDQIKQLVSLVEHSTKELLLVFHIDDDTALDVYVKFAKNFEFSKAAFVGLVNKNIVPVDRAKNLILLLREETTCSQYVVGTDALFTELNRNRIKCEEADGVIFSINPQVHAEDHLSIVETLQTEPHIAFSAKNICNNGILYISPITLKMRWNPYATSIDSVKMDSQDEKQSSDLCALWTFCTILTMSASGVELLTFYELNGEKGIIKNINEFYPLYDIFKFFNMFDEPIITQFADNELTFYKFRIKDSEKEIFCLFNLSDNIRYYDFKNIDLSSSSLLHWDDNKSLNLLNWFNDDLSLAKPSIAPYSVVLIKVQ